MDPPSNDPPRNPLRPSDPLQASTMLDEPESKEPKFPPGPNPELQKDGKDKDKADMVSFCRLLLPLIIHHLLQQ